MAQRVAELTAQAEESVSGIRVVKAFAREDHQFERFQGAVDRLFDQSILLDPDPAFFAADRRPPQLGTCPGSAGRRPRGPERATLTSASSPPSTSYMLMLAGPLRTVGMALGMGQRAIASGNRLFPCWTANRSFFSKTGRRALARRGGGAVRFDDVSLSYGPEAPDALQGIDLRFRPGPGSPWSGPSGAGKTSLAALLARLWRPDRRQRFDWTAPTSREFDLPSLRHQIAVSMTVSCSATRSPRTSPTLRPDATRDEIERAARLAQASEFIEALPDGYDGGR